MKQALLFSVTILCTTVAAPASPAGVQNVGPTRLVVADDKHKEGDHHEDEHKGEKKALGKKKIGDHEVQVTQVGDVTPGKEAVFVINVAGKSKPKAIRGWVDVETGRGAIKSKAEDEGKEYHLHHEVAKPLPANNKLWIEVETATGKKTGSFDHSPHGEKEHDHKK